MLHTNIGPKIPHQFHNLSTINSMELRTALVGVVSDLTDLRHETAHMTPDPELQNLLDRFYVFLEKSCKSPAKINAQGYWLLNYGGVVVGKMMAYRNRHVIYDSDNISTEHTAMMTRITELVIVVKECTKVGRNSLAEQAHSILEVTDAIVDMASLIKTGQKTSYYTSITREVDRLIGWYSRDSLNGEALSPDDGLSLLQRLSNLRYMIGYYVPRARSANRNRSMN